MKKLQTLGLAFCSLLSFVSYAENSYLYKQEFESFKNSPRYEAIFNENAPQDMSDLQADIEIDKNLSSFQRIVRSLFFLVKPMVISKTTMPKLYEYIATLCKSQNITMPTIFISRDITLKSGMFNAFAQKLLMSSGGILIGQKLLLETTDAELEAVIAHELGHIKYNHVNKSILVTYLSLIAVVVSQDNKNQNTLFNLILASYISQLIIGKHFEKQADEFAYKYASKGEGLIEFFEDLNQREKVNNDYYNKTYTILQESKKDLSYLDSLTLSTNYYLSSFSHKLANCYKWLYHNTRLGAHPSNNARIQAVKDYMAIQTEAAGIQQ